MYLGVTSLAMPQSINFVYKGLRMIRRFLEKRRDHPSFGVPALFFILEMILMWLVFSLINWDLHIGNWYMFTYPFVIIWIAYSGYKLYLIYKRQKNTHA